MNEPPLWLVGGLDPSGGAGVLRDFATARVVAPTRPVCVVVSAWTVQGGTAPATARAVGRDAVAFAMDGLSPPGAVKLGLVPDALVDVIAARLRGCPAPIVFDPVVRASDGGELGATVHGVLPLLRGATLVTPNRSEAEAIAATLETEPTAEALALALGVAVLIKSAEASGAHIVDVLAAAGTCRRFERNRRSGPDPRGTGCALATAIACRLADGSGLFEGVADAVRWLDEHRLGAARVGGQTVLP